MKLVLKSLIAAATFAALICSPANAQTFPSDPNNPDDDGDGLLDGEDWNPLVPNYIVANANGPYTSLAGELITFSAGGSGADRGVIEIAWDFDTDGTYDAFGGYSLDQVVALSPGTYTATLRITDGINQTAFDTASLTIVPEPSSLALLALGGLGLLRHRRSA